MSETEQAPGAGAGPTDPADGAAQRLFFHVGLPKSGSTYLQGVLSTHRTELREHDHVYPYVGREGMFHAAVEMAGTPSRWGLDPERVEGTFAHLLRRGRRLGGTVVLSHEIFGAADRDQVARMGGMLTDFDLHVVVTARDLGRSVTAAWQEEVKNGRNRSFAEFSDGLLHPDTLEPAAERTFWRSQDLLGVLERWGRLVPPERIHVVPCPPPGVAPGLLWQRFAEAVDLPAGVVDLTQVPVRNESLGSAQVALLRRVLHAVGGRLEQPWHSRVAKRWFAQTLLSAVPAAKPVAPPDLIEQLGTVARSWVEQVRAGGYQVHGDLEDLLPTAPSPGSRHPDDVGDAELLEGLPDVLAEMLVRVRELQEELLGARQGQRDVEQERDRLSLRVEDLEAALAAPPPPPPPSVPRRVAGRLARALGRSGRAAPEPGDDPAR